MCLYIISMPIWIIFDLKIYFLIYSKKLRYPYDQEEYIIVWNLKTHYKISKPRWIFFEYSINFLNYSEIFRYPND
jgi:hypothetical protein